MKKAIIVFVSVLFALSVGCVKKVPLADDQKSFAGKWVAVDGTFVAIYLDGGGDLKTSNTSVTGGKATITKDTVTIGMGPISTTMKLTAAPKEVKGAWVMTLDGITYTRQ
jgi:hypothetical protein